MTEWEMVLDSKEYFESSCSYQKVVCEVPFLSRCIDMVLVDEQKQVITIEFKLTKWRDAILQAYDHLRAADYAYICMPKKRREPSALFIDELKNKGIGLLLYDETSKDKVHIYLKAPESSRRVEKFKETLMHTVDLCS